MKVLAKDAKAGQWYVDNKGTRFLCCDGRRLWTPEGETWNAYNLELTHLPDCTGWDWKPPKPEKKYRPFANAAEFMPHRGRWVYFCDDREDQLFICSFSDRGIFHAGKLTTWGEMFSQARFDDDGSPFGVEVKK